jgi:hypothetical protein
MAVVMLAWKLLCLTWPVSLHVSRRSRRGKQILCPVVHQTAPRQCGDGAILVAAPPLRCMHGKQHAIVKLCHSVLHLAAGRMEAFLTLDDEDIDVDCECMYTVIINSMSQSPC